MSHQSTDRHISFFMLQLILLSGIGCSLKQSDALAWRSNSSSGRVAHSLNTNEFFIVDPPGCNAVALAQLPNYRNLFIGRLLQNAKGQIPLADQPFDCSGGDRNKWGLTLVRFDWNSHKFTRIKTLLDTSLDPRTGNSRSLISSGPMRGAIIESAYDADVVLFHGKYLISYECVIKNGGNYGITGTSSCISVYEPGTQSIDLNRTQVAIGGMEEADFFYAAAVPQLLVYEDRLYIYWSAISIRQNKFARVAVRGAELKDTQDGFAVRGVGKSLVHTIDTPATVEVWGPDAHDPMSSSAVDARAFWKIGNDIIAMSGKGGAGCTVPQDNSKGCFRLAMARSHMPLGQLLFNNAENISGEELPTNPQEYAHPIEDPHGRYWFIGHFLRPEANGYAELRPVPSISYWNSTRQGDALVIFAFGNSSIWPR